MDCVDKDTDPETFDPGTLPADVLASLEADSFWCLSALLDGIQVLQLKIVLILRIIISLLSRGYKEWFLLLVN